LGNAQVEKLFFHTFCYESQDLISHHDPSDPNLWNLGEFLISKMYECVIGQNWFERSQELQYWTLNLEAVRKAKILAFKQNLFSGIWMGLAYEQEPLNAEHIHIPLHLVPPVSSLICFIEATLNTATSYLIDLSNQLGKDFVLDILLPGTEARPPFSENAGENDPLFTPMEEPIHENKSQSSSCPAVRAFHRKQSCIANVQSAQSATSRDVISWTFCRISAGLIMF
jgi:hypothetical protein